MSKHTPGPWKYSTEPQPNGCPIIGAQGLMIAMLAHTVKQADQRETALANARLIAAAPELLEALRVAALALAHATETVPVVYDDDYNRVSAAIAKAVGQA